MTDHEMIRRMDAQDRILTEINAKLTGHLAQHEDIKPALDELVTLWKGSKILIPILAGLCATVWAVFAWANDHIK